MLSDSVIEGVWKAKDAIAAACDYNPEKLAEMLRASAMLAGKSRQGREKLNAPRKNRRNTKRNRKNSDNRLWTLEI